MTIEQLPVPLQGLLQPENSELLLANADKLTVGIDEGSVRVMPTVQAVPLRQFRLEPVTEPPPVPANWMVS
jgi:hypothetical protein